MNYCYGKGASLLGGCPYLGGSFIGGSTVVLKLGMPLRIPNDKGLFPMALLIASSLTNWVQHER